MAVAAFGLFAGTARAAPQQSAECRAIADPAARLACYDSQNGPVAPTPARQPTLSVASPRTMPAPPPAPLPPPPVAQVPTAPPPIAASEPPRRTTFDSRIAKVTPIRHGLHRIELEDGSAWNMTVAEQPPEPGQAVHFRRTPLGTRFFDIDGRRPISVRPAK